MLETFLNLLLSISAFLLFQLLQRSTAVLAIDLGVVFWEEHQFDATQIGRDVFSETACYEGTSAICAAEGCIRATRSIEAAAIRDIVDGAVDSEVERQSRVCAVIFFQFRRCEL